MSVRLMGAVLGLGLGSLCLLGLPAIARHQTIRTTDLEATNTSAAAAAGRSVSTMAEKIGVVRCVGTNAAPTFADSARPASATARLADGRGAAIVASNTAGLTQIAVGADGTTWGTSASGDVYRFDRRMHAFEQIRGRVSTITVGSANHVWGLNPRRQVFRFDGSRLVLMPGRLIQIAVGADGATWGVNESHEVYRFNARTERFDRVPGSLETIAVGRGDHVWGIDVHRRVFRFNGFRFMQVPGRLAQIAVGADGASWGVDDVNNVYQLNPKTSRFEQIPGHLERIDVGSATAVVGLSTVSDGPESVSHYEIYTLDPVSRRFRLVPGGRVSTAVVDAGGVVWGIDASSRTFRLPPSTCRE